MRGLPRNGRKMLASRGCFSWLGTSAVYDLALVDSGAGGACGATGGFNRVCLWPSNQVTPRGPGHTWTRPDGVAISRVSADSRKDRGRGRGLGGCERLREDRLCRRLRSRCQLWSGRSRARRRLCKVGGFPVGGGHVGVYVLGTAIMGGAVAGILIATNNNSHEHQQATPASP
jgi:hypothetical protein